MPVATPINTERRQQSYELIAKLQKERQEVLSLYCKFAGLKPFSVNDTVKSLLTRFSQLLVDYVSLGHFGVYERVLSGTERRGRVLSVAKAIYPEFSAITDAAISFNDKYENVEKTEVFEDLEQDLSVLGENLAKRIDLEDKLCEVMK
ncbi:MAG: Rsd/AlgQ family anti-sigma factor [Methylococcales bacterium]|nr:Rsd/AlgQ family anti-sigma factor [Methylococcales bacterium]MDD5630489.1 Rsd/AlgQ family anti-sigma factor [Methylococcales bacterium]